MQLVYSLIVDSPIGKLGVKTSNQQVTGVDFLTKTTPLFHATDKFTTLITNQFHQYFSSKKFEFSLPYTLNGSEFQQQVLKAVATLPYGATFTYSELAAHLNTHPRAIGNACRRNPLPVIIPCHRIIAKGGNGGYAGQMSGELMAIKLWMINHEAKLASTQAKKIDIKR